MHDLRYALGLAVALLAVPAPAAGAVMRAAGWHGREIHGLPRTGRGDVRTIA